MSNKEVCFLLVEDDEIDVMGLKRAFRKLKIGNPVYTARDGIEALEMLRGENGKRRIQEPYLILLDLNMPRMGGLEFMEEIRKDQKLKHAIIFVMTTSSDEQDIVAAYEQCIAGYIVKSDAENTFFTAISMLDHYWRVVEFPGHGKTA